MNATRIDKLFHHLDEVIFSNCHACKSGRVYFMAGSMFKDLVVVALIVALFAPWPVTTAILLLVGGSFGAKFMHGYSAIARSQERVQLDETRALLRQTSAQLSNLKDKLDRLPESVATDGYVVGISYIEDDNYLEVEPVWHVSVSKPMDNTAADQEVAA